MRIKNFVCKIFIMFILLSGLAAAYTPEISLVEPSKETYSVGDTIPIVIEFFNEIGFVGTVKVFLDDGLIYNEDHSVSSGEKVSVSLNSADHLVGSHNIKVRVEVDSTGILYVAEETKTVALVDPIILMSYEGQLYGCDLTPEQINFVNSQSKSDIFPNGGTNNLQACQSPGPGSNFYCAGAAVLPKHYPSGTTNYHPDFMMYFEEGVVMQGTNKRIIADLSESPEPYGDLIRSEDVAAAIAYKDGLLSAGDKLICDSTNNCNWRFNKFYPKEETYSGKIETGDVEAGGDDHKRYSVYTGDDTGFDPEAATITACCPNKWLWNGTECVEADNLDDPDVKPQDFDDYYFSNEDTAWLPVYKEKEDGSLESLEWRQYYKKTMWQNDDQFAQQNVLGESGFCPSDSNCFYYTGTASCEEKGFFDGDHLCGKINPSVWTSRTMSIAQILLKIADEKVENDGWDEYTLLCDDYVGLEFPDHDDYPLWEDRQFNSTCILRHGDFVVVGAHLREWEDVGVGEDGDGWDGVHDTTPKYQQRHNFILEEFFQNLIGLEGSVEYMPPEPAPPYLIEYEVGGALDPLTFKPSIINRITIYQGSRAINNHVLKSAAWLNDSSIVLLSNKGHSEVPYTDIDIGDLGDVSAFLKDYFPNLDKYKQSATALLLNPPLPIINGYPVPNLDLGALGTSFGNTNLRDILADPNRNQYSVILKHVSPEKEIEMVLEPQFLYNPPGTQNHFMYAYFDGATDFVNSMCSDILAAYVADYTPYAFGVDYVTNYMLKACAYKPDVNAIQFFALVDPPRQQIMHNDGILVSFFDHMWNDIAAAERDSYKCAVEKTWQSIDDSTQHELSSVPADYLTDDVKKMQYLPFDNMKTHGCCLETACWNGFSCIANGETSEFDRIYSDLDGDGIIDEKDDDIDGDGENNWVDNNDDDDDLCDTADSPLNDDTCTGNDDDDGDGIPDPEDKDIAEDFCYDKTATPVYTKGTCEDNNNIDDGEDFKDGDLDNDGKPNKYDNDMDGDSLINGDPDSDNDGIPDVYDSDDDNDGIPDTAEDEGIVEKKTYVCDTGEWHRSSKKLDWEAKDSNWCAGENSCFFSNEVFIAECEKHGDSTDCESEYGLLEFLDSRSCTIPDKFRFYRDHMCYEGQWTTRTGLIAAKLMDFVENKGDYVLFCDDYGDALNFLGYTGEVAVAGNEQEGDVIKYMEGDELGDDPETLKNITTGKPTNNFCVLSYIKDNTKRVAFGTSLNKMLAVPDVSGSGWDDETTHAQIFMETVFPADRKITGLSSGDFDVSAENKNEFHDLQSKKVWLHDNLQILIIDPEGIELVPEEKDIWDYFVDPIQTVISWIQGIFDEPVELRGPERADIIYKSIAGEKSVEAFADQREGSKSIGVIYKNIDADACELIKRAAQSDEDIKCEDIFLPRDTRIEQDISSTEFDDLYNQWIHMTARLRVQEETG